MKNNINNIIKTAGFICLGLSLTSCELLGPRTNSKIPLTPVPKEQAESATDSIAFQELQNKTQSTALQSKIEMYPGGRFNPSTESHRRPSKAGAPGTYSLNFDDADLGEVAKVILSDILGQNYVLSPKVTGKVTLNTTEPLSKAELLPTLEMVLNMNNAALVKDGKIYHIEPKGDALYSANVAGSSTGFQSRVIPIRNVAAQEIADIIKPLVHDKSILNVDSSRNTLVVQGTSDEIARIMDMVSTFDIDVLRGRSFALFPLNHVAPEQVIEELESIFALESGKDGSEFFRFLPIERMNAVLAITHQANYLRDVESWVYRLDRANTETSGGVNVYRVQHMDAEELAATLNEIFTGAAPRDKSAKVAAGRKSSSVSNKDAGDGNSSSRSRSSTGGTPGSGSSSRVRKKDKSDSGSSRSSGGGGNKNNDISIVADTANNSIIITATPLEFAKIMPVIKRLDIMPLQVLIDATIAQVDLKDELEYGIKWYLSEQRTVAAGSDTPSPLDSARALFDAAAASTGGLSTIYNAGDLKVLLRAQADLNNIKIISSPSVMVLNNQEARINVGDQVPIQTSNLTNAIASSGGGGILGNNNTGFAQANQIQYTDTGVTLEVTPRVNSNGMVILEILQIVSSAKETQTGVTTSPTINKEEMESTIAVKNGETIALGGLIQTDNTANRSGIPFLHELPLIGPLFGSTNLKDNRQELVVLLTPRVVKTKQDSRVVTDEFKRKLSNIYYDPIRPRRKGDWWRKRDW
ncbi:MAG: type II secretion system protein GspD [Gammaproteobacteria bacterium]|nr:type II secretion system protein GspD [Gammaproteobacteria bacterium]